MRSLLGLGVASLCAAAFGACKVDASITIDGHGPGGGGYLEERFDFIDTKTPNGTAGYTCAQVGVTKIGFTLTPLAAGATAFNEIVVDCVDGRALLVDGLPTGPYSIITKFYDANMQVVVQDNDVFQPNDPNAPVIKCAGNTTDCKLSTILHVNATGDFDFFVDYGNAGGANCQGGSTGGNGVGQQALIIDNSRNMSIPIRLVAPGTTPPAEQGGMVLNPGDVVACVENNVKQTIFNQFIGFYKIQIKGLKVTTTPAFVCYQMAAPMMFQITASTPTAAPVFLVPFMPDPGQDAACNAT
jgi:hypothetical protein